MAMADRGGFQRQEVITYAYRLLYISLSSGQIFFNKRRLVNMCNGEIAFAVPVAVIVLGVAAGLEVMSCRMLLIMLVISFGVLNGWCCWRSFEAYFHGDFCEEERSQAQPYIYDVSCEPLQGCTPLDSALCLFVHWIFLEKPKMDVNGTWDFQPIILMLNSLCTFAFALNLSVFLVIAHSSALTIRVAGVVKDWVVVLVSALVFDDTKLTMINLMGYGIAIAGVAAYNNHKLKKEASRSGPTNEQQSQSLQLTSTSALDK